MAIRKQRRHVGKKRTPILLDKHPSSRNGRSLDSDQSEPDSVDPRRAALKREVWGIALLLFALFLGGALIAEGIAAMRGADFRSSFGFVGSILAGPLVSFFGWPAAALLPIAAAAHALRVFGRLDQRTDRLWMAFLLGLVVLVPVAIGVAEGGIREQSLWSGIWGSFSAFYLLQFAGPAGAWIVLVLSISALMAATLRWNPVRAVVGARHQTVAGPIVTTPLNELEEIEAGVVDESPKRPLAALLEPPPEEMPALDPTLMDERVVEESLDEPVVETPKKKKEKKTKAAAIAANDERVAAALSATEAEFVEGDDELPPVELLTPAPPKNAELGKRELDAMGTKLMDALRTFRVEGELTGRTTGPTVTQFEIAPAAGVKVRQFANLSNDLALAMRAPSIRIVAPIPGKGAVGVEVPNPTSEMVTFRELIESPEFKSARAALPIALGKDLEGRPVINDLAKMPHLLIAGATGSGKSVCINTLITSLIYRHTPQTLRFLLVDPKMVELSVYNVLPHLRHKVVTDNRDAAAVLKWAVLEMQDRYELLAANGARNIQDFNRKVQDGAPLKKPKDKLLGVDDAMYVGGILPYIVVVIDEMADLMMTVQGEVETPLAMLAQKARAIGIHLILATQRPSVNVITGLIKANFPSRIAFRVASQIDSRTILDGMGAEALLGNGDMLFIPPGKSEPSRLQGAYISSDDTEKLMNWYIDRREKRKAEFEAKGLIVEETTTEPDILETMKKFEAEASGAGEGEEGDDSDRDKLFREAAEIVIQHQQGSTSLLQRRLKVGYGRAARIIDQLHAAGILGPPDGSKPRDVIAGLEDLDRIAGPRAL